MSILRLFSRQLRDRPQTLSPGSQLARIGHNKRRKRIRDTTDQLRRDMGLEPIKWPGVR